MITLWVFFFYKVYYLFEIYCQRLRLIYKYVYFEKITCIKIIFKFIFFINCRFKISSEKIYDFLDFKLFRANFLDLSYIFYHLIDFVYMLGEYY